MLLHHDAGPGRHRLEGGHRRRIDNHLGLGAKGAGRQHRRKQRDDEQKTQKNAAEQWWVEHGSLLGRQNRSLCGADE
jgi:hypothetical protein